MWRWIEGAQQERLVNRASTNIFSGQSNLTAEGTLETGFWVGCVFLSVTVIDWDGNGEMQEKKANEGFVC